MERYRKVLVSLWDDPEFQSMDKSLRDAAFFLLTGPQTNRLGYYRFGRGLAADYLAVSPDQAGQDIEAVCQRFGWPIQADGRWFTVVIRGWLRHNGPRGTDQAKGFVQDLVEVPQGPMDQEFRACLGCIRSDCQSTFEEALDQRSTGGGTGSEPVGVAQYQYQEQYQEQGENHLDHRVAAIGSENGTPGFEQWWITYPRKVGKRKAKEAWKRLRRAKELPPAAEVIAATERLARSTDWTKEGGKYIPHPTTWLNRGGWEDEAGRSGPGAYGTGHDPREDFN